MKKLSLVLMILAFGLSCNKEKPKATKPGYVKKVYKQQTLKPKENIRFDFTAKHIKNDTDSLYKGDVEVNATLFNDNDEAVYFLSTSCLGDQYLLCYDESKFELFSLILCNASHPIAVKIAPKGKYEFQAYFNCKGSQTKMRLGFDFCNINGVPTQEKLASISAKKSFTKQKAILWAEEKEIK